MLNNRINDLGTGLNKRIDDLRSQMSREHDTLAKKVDGIDRKLDEHISNYEILGFKIRVDEKGVANSHRV